MFGLSFRRQTPPCLSCLSPRERYAEVAAIALEYRRRLYCMDAPPQLAADMVNAAMEAQPDGAVYPDSPAVDAMTSILELAERTYLLQRRFWTGRLWDGSIA